MAREIHERLCFADKRAFIGGPFKDKPNANWRAKKKKINAPKIYPRKGVYQVRNSSLLRYASINKISFLFPVL